MECKSLSEQVFFTTMRVDMVTANGGAGSGTAFLFSYKRGEVSFPFVVTNKHVVEGMSEVHLTFLQRQGDAPHLGQGVKLRVDGWFGNPSADVDIAICPFVPIETHIKKQNGVDLFYRFVASEMIPNAEQMEKLDALETVTFIGYPNGIWDSKNLMPVARRGMTASPISVDFENSPQFLIDASVFGGSSGSPVFVLNQGMYAEKTGANIVGSRILFVGVIAAVFFRTEFNEIVAVPVPIQPAAFEPKAKQREMIDLGIVFKARTVVETIEAYLTSKGV